MSEAQDKQLEAITQYINTSQASMLRLADDIGKMADRIGQMADRIGDMADRILKTQEIQAKNLELTQKSTVEIMQTISKQMEISNHLVETVLKTAMGAPSEMGNNNKLPGI